MIYVSLAGAVALAGVLLVAIVRGLSRLLGTVPRCACDQPDCGGGCIE